MPELREIQEIFSKFLRGDVTVDGEVGAKLQSIVEQQGELSAQSRAQIYKKNNFFSLFNTLLKIYQRTNRILGNNKFRCVAQEYVKQYTSNTQSLNLYGEFFYKCLWEYLVELKCESSFCELLSDIAKLEWLFNKSFFSKQSRNFEKSRLTELRNEELENLKIICVPSLSIMESRFNLKNLWNDPQAFEEVIERPKSDYFYVAVVKRDSLVSISEIDRPTSSILNLTLKGASLRELALSFPNKQEEAIQILLNALEYGYLTIE